MLNWTQTNSEAKQLKSTFAKPSNQDSSLKNLKYPVPS